MTPDLCLLSRSFVSELRKTESLGAVDWITTGTFKGAILKKAANGLIKQEPTNQYYWVGAL